MSESEALGIASAGFLIAAGVPYIRDVLAGSTRPHRATWLIWCLLSLIALASQRADGASWSLVLVAVQSVEAALIAGLSVRRGVGGGSRIELLLLGVAALGVVGWAAAGNPLIATACVVFADLIAVVLMIPKTVRDPMSETLSAYLVGLVGVVLSALSVGRFAPALLLYPAYLLVADSAVVIVIASGRRRLRAAAR